MESVAVIHPAYEPYLDGKRRDALLTVHAAQLAHEYVQGGTRARIFSVGTGKLPGVDLVGESWNVHSARELLAHVEAFAPSCVIIEHSPLAYGKDYFVPISITTWARARGMSAVVAAHPEIGRRRDPLDAATLEGVHAANPLLSGATRVLCHDAEWARALAQRLPSITERLDVLDQWIAAEPSAVVPVDAAAAVLVVLDDVAPALVSRFLDRLRSEPWGARYRVAALFATLEDLQRLQEAIEKAGAGERVIELIAPRTPAELSKLFSGASLVIVSESRRAGEEEQWIRCAAAHGRRVLRIHSDGHAQEIEALAYASWAQIAHCFLAVRDSGAISRASFEERAEDPPVRL